MYGILMASYLLVFAKFILQRTDFALLGLSLLFFAASELFDTGFLGQGSNFLLDDGNKLLGIVGWVTYFIRTALQQFRAERQLPPAQ